MTPILKIRHSMDESRVCIGVSAVVYGTNYDNDTYVGCFFCCFGHARNLWYLFAASEMYICMFVFVCSCNG